MIKRISHTEGRRRHTRLLRGVHKRAEALESDLRKINDQEERVELISDALYLEAVRAEGRERNWRKSKD